MNRSLALAAMLALFSGVAFSQSDKPHLPNAGVVPDEVTAIKIAEAVLLPVFGEDLISKERPLHARFEKGIWTVYGTLPSHTIGGAVIVRMRKKDGRIIEVFHSV